MRAQLLTTIIASTLAATALSLALPARTSDAQLVLQYIAGLLATLPP